MHDDDDDVNTKIKYCFDTGLHYPFNQSFAILYLRLPDIQLGLLLFGKCPILTETTHTRYICHSTIYYPNPYNLIYYFFYLGDLLPFPKRRLPIKNSLKQNN